jgi:hypothetical protein
MLYVDERGAGEPGPHLQRIDVDTASSTRTPLTRLEAAPAIHRNILFCFTFSG